MNELEQQLTALPTITVDGETHLSYQAATNTVAAFLFPDQAESQIDESDYQRILETADTLCREFGYREVVRLTPPDVGLNQMGLYWRRGSPAGNHQPTVTADHPSDDTDPEPCLIVAGDGRAEMLQTGQLLDARLSQLGLDEVSRQHFKIPVIASDGVLALMEQAVASDWPNDYKGLWHDILGLCITGGRDAGNGERLFTVIIRGLGRRRYWQFKARVRQDEVGSPFLYISLATEDEETDAAVSTGPHGQTRRFALGHVVMTPGVAALGIDVNPYLARHAAGDWGELENFDKRQNEQAVKEGYRILSAYDVPLADGETERIWVITEADRSSTCLLLPSEY
jgi:hypothetical protein